MLHHPSLLGPMCRYRTLLELWRVPQGVALVRWAAPPHVPACAAADLAGMPAFPHQRLALQEPRR